MDDEEAAAGRIDQLAAAVAADPAGLPALWSAVFALESWYFVARGVDVDGRPGDDVAPFVGVLDGHPFLMAFTTGVRAQQFALRNGLATEDGAAFVLKLSPQNVVSMAPGYVRQGVFAITFDNGVTGFYAPLENLAPIWEDVRNRA